MRINRNSALRAAKQLSITQNVSLQVIDKATGKVVQEHTGHNSATNSLIFGIAEHLVGDFMPDERHGLSPAYSLLSRYVPRYISLGTMGLINQYQDAHGLPAGIGDTIPGSGDEEYMRLLEALEEAEDALAEAKAALADDCQYWPACDACRECNTCATRIGDKKQAVEDAEEAYREAYDALMDYNEEARFVEYMSRRPGYGADGYDANENNNRKYFGLGYAFSSYDNTKQYNVGDKETYNGLLYNCIVATPNPAGKFDPNCWELADELEQPSLGTTVQLELISPTFPREPISYRDIVPEDESEIPKTIDVVFSAMISTGALAQFRPNEQGYIFITEAGLWSKRTWDRSGENGLLAGYRIAPPNEKNWDMTVPENRDILKRQILKVGRNQVVQVVWKIQVGAVDSYSSDQPEPPVITYTTIYVHSKALDVEGELVGAHLKITSDYAGENVVTDARTGDILSWVSEETAKEINLEDGTYHLIESEPPEGYNQAPIISFEVMDGAVGQYVSPDHEELCLIHTKGSGGGGPTREWTCVDDYYFDFPFDAVVHHELEGGVILRKLNSTPCMCIATNFNDFAGYTSGSIIFISDSIEGTQFTGQNPFSGQTYQLQYDTNPCHEFAMGMNFNWCSGTCEYADTTWYYTEVGFAGGQLAESDPEGPVKYIYNVFGDSSYFNRLDEVVAKFLTIAQPHKL